MTPEEITAAFPECEKYRGAPHQYEFCTHQRSTPEKCDRWRVAQTLEPKFPLPADAVVRKAHRLQTPTREPVGTIFHELVESLKVPKPEGCDCEALEQEMNFLGIKGCTRDRDRLLAGIRANAGKVSWIAKLQAVGPAITSGMAFSLNPLDPAAGLFDEALRRAAAEKKKRKPGFAKHTPNCCGATKKRKRVRSTEPKPNIAHRRQALQLQNRGHKLQPINYTGPITRHLIYHVWPTKLSDQWRWNLDHVLRRVEMFNGRRIIGIVVDADSEPQEAVAEYVAGHGFEFIVRPNERIGEVLTFSTMLQMVATNDPNHLTWYMHAKGVKHSLGVLQRDGIRPWTAAQYELLMDDVPAVETALRDHVFAGSFRRSMRMRQSKWHYSGAFFAMRNCMLASRRMVPPSKSYGGVEFWPGSVSDFNEAACLLGENAGNLYSKQYFDSEIQPQLDNWRRSRIPPNAAASEISFVTACWGDYWEKFGGEFVAAMEAMDPRPAETIIVTDQELSGLPGWVRVERPKSAVPKWDWFNEAAAHATREWIMVGSIDDTMAPDGLSGLDLQTDIIATPCIQDGRLESFPSPGHWERMLNEDEPAVWTAAVFRRETFLRFPWRRVAYPDWMQWIELRHANASISFDHRPRFLHRRHDAAHTAQPSTEGEEQIRAMRRLLAAGDVQPGSEWPPQAGAAQ